MILPPSKNPKKWDWRILLPPLIVFVMIGLAVSGLWVPSEIDKCIKNGGTWIGGSMNFAYCEEAVGLPLDNDVR